ncbi:MAG TPA: amino acid permease [bacterium]|nr:amino acid permease [bacterium]
MQKDRKNDKEAGFGAFEGVFTPTILTILGVIMYLRLGWVVGNAGIGGAILIIFLAKIVTITTGLSIATMATNIKVGAGGSYALISRSLGLEIGSSVGIPLYLSQALAGAMYIIGFTEAWVAVFPSHDSLVVSFVVLSGLFVISMISAKIAMKIQYVIMAVITISLFSFFMGNGDLAPADAAIWGGFEKAPFWVVFAIFFPAVTGIEAGAAMSGDLKNPGKSLKNGILAAIGISLVIYIIMAIWLGMAASEQQLLNDYTVMMSLARWRILLVAGVFGATLSSALGSIVGGPRTLMALAQDRVIPFSRILARRSDSGEPRNAIVFTATVISICLVAGDLNSIAPLLTMFFLITYGTINLAVLIEQGTGIPSFRPSFKLPLAVPLVGSLWCFIVMIFINPYFAVAAIAALFIVYVIQVKRGLTTPWGDVRRALFVSIAEWAAKTAASLPGNAKSWKPNLVLPVEEPGKWHNILQFVRDISLPGGSLRIFSIRVVHRSEKSSPGLFMGALARIKRRYSVESEQPVYDEKLEAEMEELADSLKKDGVFTATMALESDSFLEGASLAIQVMKRMFFPPNILFMTMSADREKDQKLERLMAIGMKENLGIIILSHHPKASFGIRKSVNVWMRHGSKNINLALLTSMQLSRNWYAKIRIMSAAESEDERTKANKSFRKIAQIARMPADTEIIVLEGGFEKALKEAPPADLNIFGLPDEIDCEAMHNAAEAINASCLFVMDSGEERVWT